MASAKDRIAAYLELVARRPALLARQEGGVEIVLDPSAIRAIEQTMGERYAKRDWPREWAEVGLFYSDPYLMVLRDAVVFPGGDVGIHHRAIRREGEGGLSGAAVLALYEGRILLLRHFRHPTRSWRWEIPRGAIESGQSPEATVHAELREEIGAEASEVLPLGLMHGATGFMEHGVRLFFARLTRIGEPARDEGITGARLVSPADFEAMVVGGEITDSFTLGAFLHARLRGLL